MGNDSVEKSLLNCKYIFYGAYEGVKLLSGGNCRRKQRQITILTAHRRQLCCL
jgi:hypothetical protein